MAFNFNKAILGGRMVADPELKTTQSGLSVTTFTIAVNRKAKSGEQTQTDFLNVTAWRQIAEFITKFFRKGNPICVVGSIQTRSWTDAQGQKKYATEILADEAYFVDSKTDGQTQAQAQDPQTPSNMPYVGATAQQAQQAMTAPPYELLKSSYDVLPYEDLSNEEELPF